MKIFWKEILNSLVIFLDTCFTTIITIIYNEQYFDQLGSNGYNRDFVTR